uniref:MFS domain-containing protein n=1 Tax=Panagrellus redivivus TaxID=6233 RepID=A0A7E4ZTN6_PANRE
MNPLMHGKVDASKMTHVDPAFQRNNTSNQSISSKCNYQASDRMPRISAVTSASAKFTTPASQSTKCIVDDFDLPANMSSPSLTSKSSKSSSKSNKSKIFPSTRLFVAFLLMMCYIALAVSTSNLSVSMVCMVKPVMESQESIVNDLIRLRREANNSAVEEFLDTELFEYITNGTNSTFGNSSETGITKCELNRLRKRAIELDAHPEMLQVYEKEVEDTLMAKDSGVEVVGCSANNAELLSWTSTQQGIVFAAQNAGSLAMLFTGTYADRLNSKWCIVISLILLFVSNAVIPAVSHASVWLVVAARVLTGFADALLQPSTNSMITRWFPPKERPFAIGLITGGRQIGTLIILPTAGFLCESKAAYGGWPSIFYVSAFIVALITVFWLLLSADKPSKHFCISKIEMNFVHEKISEENLGKRNERKSVPWKAIMTCGPLYAGVAALICHEYPLVIMLQLLPKYMNDVLDMSMQMNGILSALPCVVLFISKTMSSSLASLIQSRKKGRCIISRTNIVKIFNGVASLGLGICIGLVPLMKGENNKVWAVVLLCLANVFAGMHTPGVQTALLQLAPAYSGIVTGIAFGFVAVFSIINKIISNAIVKHGSLAEWTLVFEISAVVAVLPVFFFTIWGSADRQPWATIHKKSKKTTKTPQSAESGSPEKPQFTVGDAEPATPAFTMYLNDIDSLGGLPMSDSDDDTDNTSEDHHDGTSASNSGGSINSDETTSTRVSDSPEHKY